MSKGITTHAGLQQIPGLVPLALTFAILFAVFDASANVETETKRLAFDVFLEDRPIGSHEFALSQSDERLTVSINANFAVKVLFVTAFRYEHNNVETWQNDCLESISATTQVNGTTFEVEGEQAANRFVVKEPTEPTGSSTNSPNCARTFAYWDRALLDSARLLNSQTGEFVPTTLSPLGSSALNIGDTEVPVDRYKLSGEGVEVTLAYTQSAQGKEEWVGLTSKVKGGRTLTYIRTPGSL